MNLSPSTLALVGILTLTAGCVSTRPINQGIATVIDRPAVGVEAEVELGEPVVTKGKVYRRTGISLKGPLQVGKRKIEAGFFSAVSEDNGWVYYANMQNLQGAALCLSKSDQTDLRMPMFSPAATYHVKPESPAVFEIANLEQLTEDGFKQELVYSGRNGNKVRFLYRELFGNATRVPFAQDFEHDLGDGNSLTFKGARIEIKEATGTRLRYRLDATFAK
jgi:hypothetical protein